MRPFRKGSASWKLALPALAAAALCAGCSIAPSRTTVHYSAPSVTPIRGKISDALQHSSEVLQAAVAAQAAIAKAKSLTSSLILHPLSLASAGLQEALGEASGQVNHLLTANAGLSTSLSEAQSDVTNLEGAVGAQTTDLNTCGDEKNAAIDQKNALEAKSAKDARKYHRLKFAVCSLAAALACFLAVKLGLLKLLTKLSLLGPWGMAGAAGAALALPTLIFTALWLRL
jgi:hypothetical protein